MDLFAQDPKGAPIPARGEPIGAIDRWAHQTGLAPFVGVDEAGRGPLAGPVVAAAVILPPGPLAPELHALNDSKALKAPVRVRLAAAIARCAVAVGVGIGSAELIDEINILEATRSAMRDALAAVACRGGPKVRTVLVDGHLPIPGIATTQIPLVKGDGRSWAIAAASVVAKVTRDHMMEIYDGRYPGYGFAGHKGYGTVAHRSALAKIGQSPIHRKSFKWTAPVPK